MKVNKPKALSFADIQASCSSEDYDDLGGGAFCIEVEGTIYEAKDARRLIKYLVRAEKWLANKEKYKPKGRKPKTIECKHKNTWEHPHNGDIHCEDCRSKVYA